MRLSATKAKALCKPGRYTDGEGLHLFIGKTGKKSWVQRITVDGRRRDIGLGGYPSVSLALAREKTADYPRRHCGREGSCGRKARACDADLQGSRLCRP